MEQTNNGIVPKQGWSWGAFMLSWYFLLATKRYQFLWWFLLMLIPFVNFIFLIAFMIYLGVKGHEIAAGGTQFANQSEYDGYIKGTDHSGKIFFFAMLIMAAVGIIAGIALITVGVLHPSPSTDSYGAPMIPYGGQ